VSVQNLDVIDIVVTETLLDLIEQVKALLKSFVQLNVMNSLLHLFNFNLKFVFLVGNELVKCIAGLGERDLEVYLSELQLLLVIVHTRAEILVEVDNVRADLSHLVNGVIHIIDGVGVQSLRLKLSTGGRGHSLFFHNRFKGVAFLKRSIILDQEILKVVLGDVNVLICVLHILRKLVGHSVEDNTRLVIELLQFLFLLLNKLLRELSWWTGVNGLDN
jgi:hypothetical protein